ncbi:AF4/FMR2 family member 1 [Danio aesculapii]|uniref:AF4/FMR2 family member 1 n=1 Tax=Danio aesculapii TaxID=1142201 RepID=UPI0024BFC5EC|nr:AF4/FMR2 family member 1 [Danio aesculapii]
MKKRSRHTSGLCPRPAAAPPRPQEGPDAHGKKPGKSCRELEETENTEALLLEHRQHSVEDHLKEAKKLKHKADATVEKSAKALLYLEAALAFVQSGVAMQEEPHTHTRSSYTMLSETLELIRFILKLKNYADSSSERERDFFILCLRCQALLQMTMFRYRRQVALRYSRTLAEHFQSSSCSASPSVSSHRSGVVSPVDVGVPLIIPPPVQQMALAYVNITALVLNAHDTWEQAEQLAHTGSGLLQDLDAAVGPLSLSSSISALLQYTHLGLQRLRLHTHKH